MLDNYRTIKGITAVVESNQDIYSSTALEYDFEVLVLYVKMSIFCYLCFHSTTIQKQILYFLLPYIYLTTLTVV